MNIVERKIDELNKAVYNPRRLTKVQRAHLRESLEKFGLVDPVIVNKNPDRMDIIVGGHQRMTIWKELGHETIATVEVDQNKGPKKTENNSLESLTQFRTSIYYYTT